MNRRAKKTVLKAIALSAVSAFGFNVYAQSVVIPEQFALPKSALVTSKPGFVWNVFQNAAVQRNENIYTEEALAGLLKDADGLKLPNEADPAAQGPAAGPGVVVGNVVSFDVPGVINFDQNENSNNGRFTPDLGTPGIPGTSGSNNGIAAEALTYLDLEAGDYTFVVNSDDGFTFAVGGVSPSDKQAILVGQFNGGRGASDTVFNFTIAKAGVYPARLTWQEGGGGANVELFSQKAGVNTLINDPAGIKAYRAVNATVGAFFSKLSPAAGSSSGPLAPISFDLTEGTAAIDASTLTVTVDGTKVTAPATKVGKVVSATYTPTQLWEPGSTHNVVIAYKEGGQDASKSFSFSTLNYPLLTTAQASANVDTSKRGFLWNVHQVNSGQPNNNARTESQLAGALGANIADPSAQGAAIAPAVAPNPATAPITFEVDSVINFDQAEGSNNGRFTPDLAMPGIPGTEGGTDNVAAEVITHIELPAGVHRFVVNSDDGFHATTGAIRDPFSRLFLGEFNGGRGASDTQFEFAVKDAGIYPFRFTWQEGGGGANIEIFSLKADGSRVLLNDTANGGLKTYRKGDVQGISYGKLLPGAGSVKVEPDVTIDVAIQDGGGAGGTVNKDSVKLKVNGADVAATVAKTGNTTTVTYKPAQKYALYSTVSVELASNVGTAKWSFGIRGAAPNELDPKSFWIEAEDFNYDNGKTVAAASTMPYAGGAYDGLGGVKGVDFVNADGADSDLYRTETDANGEHEVNLNDNLGGRYGKERPGPFEVTTNYKLGWVADGEWQNYTRTIPAGSYKVYAALSYDGTAPDQLRGSLSLVTAGATTANQTVTALGTFAAPGSGGWGPNDLVQMKDTSGSVAIIDLPGGPTTLRFNLGSGDFDWFVLEPATKPTSAAFKPVVVQGGNLVLEWTGGGTLQAADNVNGPWTDVAGATSPRTVSPAGARKFYRIKL